MMTDALVVVAKAPVEGQVKTRLCPPLSASEATELFRCFLADTVARARAVPRVQICLAITPAGSEDIFRALLPHPVRYVTQRGDSFGDRLANVFEDLLRDGFRRVVIIDSDSPTLPMDYVQEAFTELGKPDCEAVYGPCSDGGYYLVGARALHRCLFENITWSTPAVLQESLAQARLHGLNVGLLPPWYDVDVAEDLEKLVLELGRPGSAHAAPRTHAFLSRLSLAGSARSTGSSR